MTETPEATALIPAPRRIVLDQHRHGRLDEGTRLEAGPGTEGVARWLRATLGAATGFPFRTAAAARRAATAGADSR